MSTVYCSEPLSTSLLCMRVARTLVSLCIHAAARASVARHCNMHKNHVMAGSYALLIKWVRKTASIFALLGSATYEYMHNEKQNQLLLIKTLH